LDAAFDGGIHSSSKRGDFVMHRLLIVLVFSLLLALALAGLSVAQEDMVSDTSTVHLMSDGSEVEDSWSTLTRYENGVAMTLHTSGLTPGDVVTAWWVIFNAPENCSDDCGPDDVFLFDDAGTMIVGDNGPQPNVEQREAAQISILGATGNLIGESSEGHFAAWLGVGEVPGVLFGPALQNPSGAEIHVVLRTHGPLDAETFDEQITAFNGGCAAEFPNEPCRNIQNAVHQPA
jgi:hypothetical protein